MNQGLLPRNIYSVNQLQWRNRKIWIVRRYQNMTCDVYSYGRGLSQDWMDAWTLAPN